MKALVTGLNGFTGFYLKNELEAYGYTVIGLVSNLLDTSSLNTEIREIAPDVVVHLAGIAFVGHGKANDFYQVNLLGTLNLLTALEQCENLPRCVLLASSANIYGNTDSSITEEMSTHPMNDYAVSKLAMEYVARLWFDRLPIVIVRPFNYTGIGQPLSFLLPKIIDHFRRKCSIIELGNLDIVRDFSDVRTIVQTYRKLLETPSTIGEIFNVCSGRAYSLNEVITMIQHISGHTLDVQINPVFVRTQDVKILKGSKEKIEKYIGLINVIPLNNTLKWMLEVT
jgi:nucleoside-diphosphate-sugar epimerase